MKSEFIAHRRTSDGEVQLVSVHLRETGTLTEYFAAAIGLPLCGRLIGLCHDLGKYSQAFLIYIWEVTGMCGPELKAEAERKRGTVDHATAGAQLIWETLAKSELGRFLGQILAVCVMSHHSRVGLIDFVALDGSTPFLCRIDKDRRKTHFDEVLDNADPSIVAEIKDLLSSGALFAELRLLHSSICRNEENETLRHFHYGLLTRFLFSCLLDADRLNTANFEKPKSARFRATGTVPKWAELTRKLEQHLTSLPIRNGIDRIRNRVSEESRAAASRSRGIFTLTVPTGGGKTLASLRFALHHALSQLSAGEKNPIERIIYVIPYTSIIDQNASVVRDLLGEEVVLEHHSNLVPEKDNWRNRVLSENWDAPIVFTTSVQLLNALFDSPTGATRRMHQLANSVIIFDEIQTLPVKTIHIFNNAIIFLVNTCHTSVVFCTATQPLIGEVNRRLGAVAITPESEIVGDVGKLFNELKRTQITDVRRPSGWSYADTSKLAKELLAAHRSVLIVVNTKDAAFQLFTELQGTAGAEVFHLSTHLCPAHRKAKLDAIGACLDPDNSRPVICVSTQLIEAGVDLDFGSVIRSLAGLDSIAQAGGRCNRNGRSKTGPVFVVNLSEERVGSLYDIQQGQECTRTILDDFKSDAGSLGNDLLSPEAMRRFYTHYFFRRANEMTYPLKSGKGAPSVAADTSLLALLALNEAGTEPYCRGLQEGVRPLPLRQALSTAALAFRVIDAPTQGIVVPYGENGRAIIGKLASAFATDDFPLNEQVNLLRQAQQYTVNVFPNTMRKLIECRAIHEIVPESGIYHLDDRYYHEELGVTHEALSELPLLHAE